MGGCACGIRIWRITAWHYIRMIFIFHYFYRYYRWICQNCWISKMNTHSRKSVNLCRYEKIIFVGCRERIYIVLPLHRRKRLCGDKIVRQFSCELFVYIKKSKPSSAFLHLNIWRYSILAKCELVVVLILHLINSADKYRAVRCRRWNLVNLRFRVYICF